MQMMRFMSHNNEGGCSDRDDALNYASE